MAEFPPPDNVFVLPLCQPCGSIIKENVERKGGYYEGEKTCADLGNFGAPENRRRGVPDFLPISVQDFVHSGNQDEQTCNLRVEGFLI